MQGDRAYEARQISALSGSPDLGIRAGPVSLGIRGTLNLEYSDNIRYQATDRQSDFIVSPGVTLGGIWNVSDSSRLSAGVGLAYRKYLDYDENDYLRINPQSQIAWDFSIGDVYLSVYNTVSYRQDLMDVGELVNRSRFPRLENTAGLTVSWLPERWILQAGYAYYRLWAFEDEFEYLDRGSHQLFGRVGRSLVVRTRAGLESSLSLTGYDLAEDDPLRRNDFQSYSFGPFADWFIRSGMRLGVRGGYTRYTFDPLGARPTPEDQDGGYGAVEFSHQLTSALHYRLAVTHTIQAGVRAALTERTDAHLTVRYTLPSRAYAAAGFRYLTEQRTSGIGERYTLVTPNLTLGYPITPRLRSTLAYTFQHRDSNVPGRNYDVNRVALGLDYRF